MKRVLKWLAYGVLTIVLVVVALLSTAYVKVESKRNSQITETVPHIELMTDEASLQEGARLASMKGCRDCHGANLAGGKFIDEAPIGRVYGPNLTGGLGSRTKDFSTEDWVRAIRFAVGKDGRPLVAMPADDYSNLSLEQTALIISYLKSLPPIDQENPPISIGPVARLMYLGGNFPMLFPNELVNREAPTLTTVKPEASVAYGKYLSASCISCHGSTFAGGKIPGVPPEWPAAADLRPGGRMKGWSLAQFKDVLTKGMTPEGRQINPAFMPWKATAAMSDLELEALQMYLASLPAQ